MTDLEQVAWWVATAAMLVSVVAGGALVMESSVGTRITGLLVTTWVALAVVLIVVLALLVVNR